MNRRLAAAAGAVAVSGVVVAAPTIQPNEAEFATFDGVAVVSGAFDRAQAQTVARLAASGTRGDRHGDAGSAARIGW